MELYEGIPITKEVILSLSLVKKLPDELHLCLQDQLNIIDTTIVEFIAKNKSSLSAWKKIKSQEDKRDYLEAQYEKLILFCQYLSDKLLLKEYPQIENYCVMEFKGAFCIFLIEECLLRKNKNGD